MKKLLFGLVLLIGLVSLSGCESGKRTMKDLSSEFGGGLHRTVEVYSQDGKLIKTYQGNLDIKTNEYGNKVLFDLKLKMT